MFSQVAVDEGGVHPGRAETIAADPGLDVGIDQIFSAKKATG